MTPVRRRLLIATALAVCAVLSVLAARGQGPGTDFHARWLAGRWFWSGDPLYTYLPGVREPTYPPFATMVFQVFALFPLKVAAGLFYFCNLLLIPVTLRLTRDVFDGVWPDRRRTPGALPVAIVLSAQFFLNNLNLNQVNIALFALCLYGLRAYLRGDDWRAVASLVGATAVKLVPVFLVIWLVIRGRRRAAAAVVPLGLACVALPMVQRGPAQGVHDLKDYYQTLLQGFGEGRVVQRYTNQNLAAATYRMMRPPAPDEPTEWDYRWFTAPAEAAQLTYRTAALLLLGAFVGVLVLLRSRAAPLTVFELSAAFLIGHLLSAMTWKAHLVTLLFVFYAVLSLDRRAFRPGERALHTTAIVLMTVSGLSGRDVFGDTVHHYMGGYSVLVWTMLLLFGASLWFSWRRVRA